MKRFVLFSGHIYYSVGGWEDALDDDDCLQHYNTLAEAKKAGRLFAAIQECYWWWHVVDLESGRIVHKEVSDD